MALLLGMAALPSNKPKSANSTESIVHSNAVAKYGRADGELLKVKSYVDETAQATKKKGFLQLFYSAYAQLRSLSFDNFNQPCKDAIKTFVEGFEAQLLAAIA